MQVFEMVFGIVVVVMIAGVVKSYLDGRRDSRQYLEDESVAMDRIAALEERIQVLEKIITDRQSSLKREIDGL